MANLEQRLQRLEAAASPQWLAELDALLFEVLGKPESPENPQNNDPEGPTPKSFDELVCQVLKAA